jgi:hypothetical protein
VTDTDLEPIGIGRSYYLRCHVKGDPDPVCVGFKMMNPQIVTSVCAAEDAVPDRTMPRLVYDGRRPPHSANIRR